MRYRPYAVTLVGGLLAISGFYFMVRTFLESGNDMPAWASPDEVSAHNTTLIVRGLSFLISFVSGVFILNGANWARWLYTGKCGVMLLLELTLFSVNLFPFLFGLGIEITFIVLLFFPDSNDYFSAG